MGAAMLTLSFSSCECVNLSMLIEHRFCYGNGFADQMNMLHPAKALVDPGEIT